MIMALGHKMVNFNCPNIVNAMNYEIKNDTIVIDLGQLCFHGVMLSA